MFVIFFFKTRKFIAFQFSIPSSFLAGWEKKFLAFIKKRQAHAKSRSLPAVAGLC
jgi:hypothetical protein